MEKTAESLLLVLAGAVAGEITYRGVQSLGKPDSMSALFLVTAAVAYPLADLGAEPGPERTRERASVGAAVALGLAGAVLPRQTRRRLLAAGWLSHACFDATHHRNRSSVLPGWYPPVCAGFDAVVAARLWSADSLGEVHEDPLRAAH